MTIDEFQKVDLRVARVLKADRVEGSEKLLRLELDAGDKDDAGEIVVRQILAGIGKAYEPDALVQKEIIIVANLEPRMLMGQESRGMLLAASGLEGKPVILTVEESVEPGTKIK